MRRHERHQPTFEQALAALRDPSMPGAITALNGLSGLDRRQIATLRDVWAEVELEERLRVIRLLAEVSETEYELDFGAVIAMALDDPDAGVRALAAEGILADADEPVIRQLNRMAESDPAVEVRAAAVAALGQFILMGEYDDLPEALAVRLQETALRVHNNPNEPLEVRRRALEAVSNCGRDEVNDLIRAAYQSPDLDMRVSAIFAMGRTCDDVWGPDVLRALNSEHSEIRYEAARAAGELELRRAVPRLAEFARGDDREIQMVAVWSLGEIGGDDAKAILHELAERAERVGDEDLIEAVDEAMSVSMLASTDPGAFLESMEGLMPMFDLSRLADYLDDIDEDEDDEDDDYLDEDEDELDGLIVDEEDEDFEVLPGFRQFSIEDGDIDPDEDLDDDYDLGDLPGLDNRRN